MGNARSFKRNKKGSPDKSGRRSMRKIRAGWAMERILTKFGEMAAEEFYRLHVATMEEKKRTQDGKEAEQAC